MSAIVIFIIGISSLGFFLGQSRSRFVAKKTGQTLNSLPRYYGLSTAYKALFLFLFLISLLYFSIGNDTHFSYVILLTGILTCISMGFSLLQLKPSFPARNDVEKKCTLLLISSAFICFALTLSLLGLLLFESIRFFQYVPLQHFFLGLEWNPQLVSSEASSEELKNAFGALPVLGGTFFIAFLALLIASPLGIGAALYLSEYASQTTRAFVKPLLEIFAGIPTVVYGYCAVVAISPGLRYMGEVFNLTISSESALGAGIVMGFMLVPFILSLTEEALQAVPHSLRQASLAMGATQGETICKIVLHAALPTIINAISLAFSRAVGETMIVVMAAGLTAHLTLNPFSANTTVTAQIVTLLQGDYEADSPQVLSAFALGLTLFILTLFFHFLGSVLKSLTTSKASKRKRGK